MSNNPFNHAQTFMGGLPSAEADDIFGDVQEEPTPKVDLPGDPENPEDDKKKRDTIPEGGSADAKEVFGDDDNPESVGEGDDKEGKETGTGEAGSSPKGENPFASFAQALKGDGLFQFLPEDVIKGVVDADTFRDAMEQEVNSRLEDAVREVKEALDAGVQPSVIAQHQRTIQNLEAITEDKLNAETPEGANLRKAILKQDLFIRGYKPDRIEKQVERIMESGSDIEEAAEALEAVKEYYRGEYAKVVNSAKEAAAEEKRKTRQEAEDFRKSVLETNMLFDDIPVDKATRQKAFDAMTRTVDTTEEGERRTAVQKYADENPVKFRTILGLVWAMTDGFEKPGNLFKKSVDKKVNSNLKELERRLNNQAPQGGSFNLVEGENGEKRSSRLRGLRIDIP